MQYDDHEPTTYKKSCARQVLKTSLNHNSYVLVLNTNPLTYLVSLDNIIHCTNRVPTQPIKEIKRVVLDQILKDRSFKLVDIRYELLLKKNL